MSATAHLQKIKNQWDTMSKYFQEKIENATISLTQQLTSIAKCNTANSVLELGAGCGGAAVSRALLMKPHARHVVSDLSEEMVALAKAASASLPEAYRFEAVTANAEETTFDNASFDAIIANLVIQITPSAEAMAKECHRLLTEGGRLAVSFWGDREKSPMFTLVPQSMKEVGINPQERGLPGPPARENFHLGKDLAAVKTMMLSAGFSRVFYHKTTMKLDIASGEEFAQAQFEAPMFAQTLAVLSEEEKDKLFKKIADNAEKVLERGELIGLDAVVLLAIK